jgi:mannose-1-phosphate guanylyltransferase
LIRSTENISEHMFGHVKPETRQLDRHRDPTEGKMEAYDAPWAVVLAAGEGNRLRSLTTDPQGNSIPKQFCSLNGGASLLQLALRRAARVAPWSRITTIVATQHEVRWRGELGFMPESNVVVQPCNRGTAVGALLPLLRILARDPAARVVLLPSDHFVVDERVLEGSLRQAMAEIERRPERVVLLGIVPDEPDTEFGWIVPAGRGGSNVQEVLRFVEKPSAPVASELMGQGGVWNSFILAANGKTLLEFFDEKLPGVSATLQDALAGDPGVAQTTDLLSRAYDGLGSFDFCRDVLEGQEHRLSVLPVPRCGWSDLGTPDRVARCVERMPNSPAPTGRPAAGDIVRLDLAHACLVQHACLTP